MNKKQFTRPAILLAAALAFAACSNEDVQVDNPDPKPTDGKMKVSITGAMDDEGRDTRSSFVYGTDLYKPSGDEYEKFQWEAGDKINLRFSKQYYSDFTKNILSAPDDLNPGHSSTTFSGEINKYSGEQTIYAVSPATVQIGVGYNSTLVEVSYPQTVTQKGTDLSHLGDTDYMWAKTNFNVGEHEENPLKGMKLNFEHLGAMLRFQIKNASTTDGKKYTLQSVTVREESTSQLLWDEAHFNLADEKPLLQKNSYFDNPKTVEVDGATEIRKEETFDAYMMVPASYDKDLNLARDDDYRFIVEVVVKEDETEKKLIRKIEINPSTNGTFLNNGFEAGMRYYFVISVNEGKLQGYYKVVNVEDAGTLSTLVDENTERLKLTGTINRQDFVFMKNMKKLYDLDLSEVTIEEYKDEDVTYPAKTIPDKAFANKGSLRYIALPKNLEAIGENAFSLCSGFTGELIIPDNVTTIGKNAFNSCSGFTGDLTIPNTVDSIGESAFWGCSGFTGDLIIPESVTTIANFAFTNCSGLAGTLKLPVNENFKTINKYAFSNCGFTGDLIIPESVTTIGGYAFDDCSGFTGDLIIPESVTTIGEFAFYSCSGFTGDLTIPNNVTTIGEYAFYSCSGFTGDLTIPKSVRSINSGAFEKCQFSKINLYWEDYTAILPYKTNWGLPDVTTTVPNGKKTLYEDAPKNWPTVEERGQ